MMGVDKMITLLFIGKMLFDQLQDIWADNLEESRIHELFRSMDVWCQQFHGMSLRDYAAEEMKAPDEILARLDTLVQNHGGEESK